MRKSLKLLFVIMTIVTLCITCTITASAGELEVRTYDGPEGGYGADGYTIYISNMQGLVHFISQVWDGYSYEGRTVLLDNDIIGVEDTSIEIAMANYYFNNNARTCAKQPCFSGTFDGQGHKIKWFGYTAETGINGMFYGLKNATIKNVTFEDVATRNINDKADKTTAVGTIAAYAFGENVIENVKITSTDPMYYIYGSENVGGLIGVVSEDPEFKNSLKISNCNVDMDIFVSDVNGGGFVGSTKEGTSVYIENSTVSGNIYSSPFRNNRGQIISRGHILGGFIGNSADACDIKGCTNNAAIGENYEHDYVPDGDNGNNGGFIGKSKASFNLEDCTNNGLVTAQKNNAGGFVGYHDANVNGLITNCTNTETANITADGYAGGLVGYFNTSIENPRLVISGSINNAVVKSNNSGAAGMVGFLSAMANGWFRNEFNQSINNGAIYGKTYAGGMIAENHGYTFFEDSINKGSINAEEGIAGGFTGWDREGYAFFINSDNYGEITAKQEAGGFIGYYGNRDSDPGVTFESCTNNASVISKESIAGGIIGRFYSDGIAGMTKIKNNGSTTGEWTAGGIIGESEGKLRLETIFNYGDVTSNGANAGGIIGWNCDDELSLKDCTNSGKINGKCEAGGILGYTGNDDYADRDMYFEDCHNYGEVNSMKLAGGGIAGKLETDGTHIFKNVSNTGKVYGYTSAAGILAETMGTTSFTDASNTGHIGGAKNNAGGILAWSENQPIEFKNCSNSGSINAAEYAGGIGGVMYDEAADPGIYAENCTNSGKVNSKTTDAGGIIGALCTDGDCTFINCKNTTGGKITGAHESGGIFGWTCGNNTLVKNCSNSGSITTTGSKDDGFYAGTLYGSSENGVTCEGCTNYAASIFTGYSLWIIIGCVLVVAAVVVFLLVRKRKQALSQSANA